MTLLQEKLVTMQTAPALTPSLPCCKPLSEPSTCLPLPLLLLQQWPRCHCSNLMQTYSHCTPLMLSPSCSIS